MFVMSGQCHEVLSTTHSPPDPPSHPLPPPYPYPARGSRHTLLERHSVLAELHGIVGARESYGFVMKTTAVTLAMAGVAIDYMQHLAASSLPSVVLVGAA